ncbi:MAG TPA: DUF2242 domain-containing protein [Steroidobacteraceae bacterium]|nr:DUF2242 domain-containing protein [Steroidobacteraceae bacterium]
MRKTTNTISLRHLVVPLAAAAAVIGCASKHDTRGDFAGSAPFSKTISGPSDAVCWSVKRALLGQGYMLERSSEPGVLTGTRDYQPEEKVNITLRLQTTCADNRNGTSIVFVTAEREVNKLQKMRQTTSAGIGPATVTMPAGSARVLGIVKRETIADPNFYNSFFALVEGFVAQEGQSNSEHHAEQHAQASH